MLSVLLRLCSVPHWCAYIAKISATWLEGKNVCYTIIMAKEGKAAIEPDARRGAAETKNVGELASNLLAAACGSSDWFWSNSTMTQVLLVMSECTRQLKPNSTLRPKMSKDTP